MESSNQQVIPPLTTINDLVSQVPNTSQNLPRSNVGETSRLPRPNYTLSPYNLSCIPNNEYFVADMDDMLRYLVESIPHPILEDLDVAKGKEDRLL